jgi:hypothetical protein
MTINIGGPGIPLPAAQSLYPANLSPVGTAYSSPSNEVSLAPGQSIQIPAGQWQIYLGKVCVLQYQDPTIQPLITQTAGAWRIVSSGRTGPIQVRSDGTNFRVSNLTGCAIAAQVGKGGTTYTQAATTVTPSTGNSTWAAIVGGRVAHLTCSAVGSNYTVAPLVFLSAPPSPGIQATAVATISAGSVNGFTVTNQGAGYTTAPTVTVIPSPFDPGLAGTSLINAAIANCDLTGSGTVSAVICTNSGTPVATSMTLSVSGGDGSAIVVPVFLTTLTAITASAVGSGTITGAMLSTIGGQPLSNIFTNPMIELNDFIPRQAQAVLGVTSGALNGTNTIIDGGLFAASVSGFVISNPQNTSATPIAPTVALTVGSINDTVIIQPI